MLRRFARLPAFRIPSATVDVCAYRESTEGVSPTHSPRIAAIYRICDQLHNARLLSAKEKVFAPVDRAGLLMSLLICRKLVNRID